MLRTAFGALLLLAACGRDASPPAPKQAAKEASASVTPSVAEEVVLPNNETPLGEAPAQSGAQEAATVLETYYALIAAGKYREAWKLRWSKPADSPDAFVESFGKYATYRANVGTPSEPQGAAGSLYVEVPVQIYGKLKNGEAFSSAGSVTLRRSNDVPGSTPEQRKWRIYS